jgi:hypothetical protein
MSGSTVVATMAYGYDLAGGLGQDRSPRQVPGIPGSRV